MGVELEDGWSECERGNTLLVTENGENMVAWIDVGRNRRLEVSFTPGNYPALELQLLSEEKSTDAHLANHINTRLAGWFVRKCNMYGVHYNTKTLEVTKVTEPEEDDDGDPCESDESDGLE